MSLHHRKSLRAVAAIVVAVLAAMTWPRPIDAQEYGERRARRTLEGTWWVQVTALSDCNSRTPLGSFTALLTFARGGTMTGTTTNPAFANGQRRSGSRRLVSRRCSARLSGVGVAFLLFTTLPNPPSTPGFQAGSQRLDQTIALVDADHFTSDAITQFFDVAGHMYREGCATAAAYRFE